MEFTGKQIVQLWDSGSANRMLNGATSKYYKCVYDIPELGGIRSDGRAKSALRTNWTKYVVDQHVGFLTTNDIQYSTNLDDASGIEYLYEIIQANGLNTIDTEHLHNCLLYGQSVEIHSYSDYGYEIVATKPNEWVFMMDARDKEVAALRKAVLPASTFHNGAMLAKDVELFTLYDNEFITTYEKSENGLVQTDQIAHNHQRMPVIRFRIQKDNAPFIDSNFFALQRAYDVVRSTLIDDIKYSVDGVLIMKGVDINALLEKDDDGRILLEKLREMKILPIGQEASVSPLSITADIEKYRYDLRVGRSSIHLAGCIPDLTDTVNANGASPSISGIALKVLYQSQIQKAGEFAKYYEQGLRDRISLINAKSSTIFSPLIEDYDIKIQPNIPQANIEWLQYLTGLEATLPKMELYRQLPFLDNPERVYAEWLAEQDQQKELSGSSNDTSDLEIESI